MKGAEEIHFVGFFIANGIAKMEVFGKSSLNKTTESFFFHGRM